MAGHKTKAPKGSPKWLRTVGSDPPTHEDGTPIDARVHQQGYELWRSGVMPSMIRQQLHISKEQFAWLLEIGNARIPAYRSLLIDEVTTIRTNGRKAAAQLSESSVEWITGRMENAVKATEVMAEILDRALRKEIHETDIAMLKALAVVSNATPAADAFARIYGDVAATRALHPTSEHRQATYVEALAPVQGESTGDKQLVPAETRDAIGAEMGNWTEAQMEEFARTGVEPSPSEVA